LLTTRQAGAPSDAVTAGGLSAFATMANAVAAAWPTNAIVPPPSARAQGMEGPAEVIPGSYGYTLVRPLDSSNDVTTLTVIGDRANPAPLWPELAVDDGSGAGLQALVLSSSTPTEATYTYPAGIARGQSLRYQASLKRLDVVMIPDFDLSVSVIRNANLVAQVTTCPLFVYRTPYIAFPSPLVPLLLVDEDFDIGLGTTQQLEAALRTFLESLLDRANAPGGSQRPLRVAASYGYEFTRPAAVNPAAAVRGAKSAMAEVIGLVPTLPIALIPSVELTINGDNN